MSCVEPDPVPYQSNQPPTYRAILVAERVALNFLQRMSGIATLTKRMVDAVEVRY